jgi:WD40 repeat protein
VVFAPDGATLVTLSLDAGGLSDEVTVRLWDVASGRELALLFQANYLGPPLLSVAFSPDGRKFAALTAGDCVVWDVPSAARRAHFRAAAPPDENSAPLVAFSPEGRPVVAGSEGGRLNLWDAATGKALGALAASSGWSVMTQPGGTRTFWYEEAGGAVMVLDGASGRHRATRVGGVGICEWVAITPDGRWCATTCGGAAQVRDLRGGRVRSFAFGEGDGSPALSPDGGTLAVTATSPAGRLISYTAGWPGRDFLFWLPSSQVELWDVASGRPTKVYRGAVQAYFSPDGRTLALLSEDGVSLALWGPDRGVPAGGRLLLPVFAAALAGFVWLAKGRGAPPGPASQTCAQGTGGD